MREVSVGLLAAACLAAGPAVAQEAGVRAIVLDPVLRHIGDGRYGPQCGSRELKRMGVWGDRYSIDFRTGRPGRFRTRIQRVWGVAGDSVDAVSVDGRRIGWLAGNQDPRDPRCGVAWTSDPFDLGPGRHVLEIMSGPLREGIDDVAFEGVAILGERPGMVLSHGRGRVTDAAVAPARPPGWVEVLMDTTTVVATFGILAFLVERLTNGIAIVLGYWGWWRQRMEVRPTGDPDTRAQIERNRRVALFALSAVLAVIGAVLMELDILTKLGLASAGTGGYVVTGLLIAAGADPIREVFKLGERGREAPPPAAPIQVSGTLVVQQAPAPTGGQDPATARPG